MDAKTAQHFLRSVAYNEGFHFFMVDGHYSGETAVNLCFFLRDLQHVDIQSIRFHFDRGDFQRWLRTKIGDEELARRIDAVDTNASDETLRQKLASIVEARIVELKAIES